MKQEPKIINFYRLALLKGCYAGMEQTSASTLAVSHTRHGSYITPMVDTGDADTTYHRLRVDGQFSGASVEIIVAATDDPQGYINDKHWQLEDYFASNDVLPEDKIAILQSLPSVTRRVGSSDILLHEVVGRYVWAFVGIYPTGTEDCMLDGLKIWFPKATFSDYFPEIYQGNPTFEKYLSVFQSMFLDIEGKVDSIPCLLDYETAPDDSVAELAEWVGLGKLGKLLDSQKLRYMIRHLDVYQGGKGTKATLGKLVELITGIRPRIVEYFSWNIPKIPHALAESYGILYGSSPNCFCVMLDLKGKSLNVSVSELEKLIEQYSPLDCQCKLVLLNKSSHVDAHCYLDVNASLSVPEVAGLDNGAFGGHITVG